MNKTILLLAFSAICLSIKAQVIISELNDPQVSYLTNRWLEITNIDVCDVSLSDYDIIAIGNSTNGTVAGAAGGTCTWSPTGILSIGASVTFGGTANTAFTPTFTSASFNNGTSIVTNWNGQQRDGARLEKNGVLVDLAWIANGTGAFFVDRSLRRNATVCQGSNPGSLAQWTSVTGTNHTNHDTHTNTVPWCGVSCALPVELAAFSAKVSENNREVNLEWSTASELNNDYFTIERSADGLVWEDITSVDGAGTSSELNSYFGADHFPLAGTSYYRVKQTDFDGSSDYTEVRVVNIGGFGHNMALVGYQVNEETVDLRISFYTSDKYTLNIYDGMGHLVLSMKTDTSFLELNKYYFPSGMYFVQLSNEFSTITEKIIVP